MVDMVDVSNYNPITDINAVKASGVQTVYIHAFEYGPNQQSFPGNWQMIHDAGIQRGAYCFARPDAYNSVNQANEFVDYVVGLGFGGTDFFVLDAEVDGINGSWAYSFCNTVRQRGYPIAVYASTSYLYGNLGADSRLSVFPLIVADYGPNDGSIHPISQTLPWKPWAHQYTSVGSVPGVAGQVDCNVFVNPNLNPSGGSDLTQDEHNQLQLVFQGVSALLKKPDATVVLDQATINNMATAIAQAVVNGLIPHLKGNWSAS